MRNLCKLAVAVVFVLGIAGIAQAGGPPPPDAPEIDPSFAAGALTLLVGGVLALTSRARR